MTDQTTQDDEAKQQIKQHYREQTGEELPDHVVENIEYLQASRYNAERLERLRELESKYRHDKSGVGAAMSIDESSQRNSRVAFVILGSILLALYGLIDGFFAGFSLGFGSALGGATVAFIDRYYSYQPEVVIDE